MNTEPINDVEELIQNLGDRIEDIERILYDDEEFCNKDIDVTYQTAIKYIRTIEDKFQEKLTELKQKLDRVREENLKISKQNRKQFDEETETINQLFLSGKYEEAKQKLQIYEKYVQQRVTLIHTIPRLYMNDIDVNRYFSIDKPISIPVVPVQEIKQEQLKSMKQANEYFNEQECDRACSDIRHKRSDSQQVPTNNNSTGKDAKSPINTVSTRSLRISTRLTSSPSNKNLSLSDSDRITPPSEQNNYVNPRESMQNSTLVRPVLSTPNVISTFDRQFKFTPRTTRTEVLTPVLVAHYQHEQNTSLLMACNKDYIVLFKSQSNRLIRWYLNVIVRYNKIGQDLDWDVLSITSVGSIDRNNLYIFTEHDFIIYSLDSFSTVGSYPLTHANEHSLQDDDIKHSIGTVFNGYIYHISYNNKFHWLLSIFDLESMNNLFDYDLTEAFSDVKRFIHICVNHETVGFLVELDSGHYAVIFCSNHHHLTMSSRRLIHLSYAESPLIICSVYIKNLQKNMFFINDVSAKIIHLLTIDKYIQSYPITVHSLCYIEENDEILLASKDGIYAIRLKDHESFFAKLH
ncbi:hypothetical protein I4U23_008466 [Adineta vaga]|nr:hypothetical protein I4U23_008466 [Adineta vaga]